MLATNLITEALGGRKVLGKKLDSTLDMADFIQEGLPSQAVFFLQKTLGFKKGSWST